jgi:hypothetical protein
LTERLTHDRAAKAMTYCFDETEGPTADALKYLARVVVHITDKGNAITRYSG